MIFTPCGNSFHPPGYDFRSRVNFVFLNVDNPKWRGELDEFGVDGIPHFSFLDSSGDEVAYVVGRVPRRILAENCEALADGLSDLPHSQVISESSDSSLRRDPSNVQPRSHSQS